MAKAASKIPAKSKSSAKAKAAPVARKALAKSAPKPVAKAAVKPAAKPAVKPAAKTVSKAVSKTVSKTVSKRASKAPTKPVAPKLAVKPAPSKAAPAKAAPVTAKAGKWVYTFGDGKAEGKAEMRDLLGGKGANLAEMANLGLPVPPGFTIPTSVCTYFYAHDKSYPKELQSQVEKALAHVGKLTGKSFGDSRNPLLVSVRSGGRASMPGMMDTVLNLGLNDETVEALSELSGDRRFAYDSYRRFITMYSDVVLGFEHHHFEEILDTFKDGQGYTLDTDLTAEDWVDLVGKYKDAVARETGKDFSAGSARPALGRDRRGVFILDERARGDLPQAARHSGILGHRGQRAGHGVRQHGRDLGNRRCLHPQPVDRREQALRRVPDQRAR
ncbi:hypothetical protein ACVWWR_005224 [Bradyrhizobium sp. LM3.2]